MDLTYIPMARGFVYLCAASFVVFCIGIAGFYAAHVQKYRFAATDGATGELKAARIAMVGHGHSIDRAALGIRWHVLAMFAPSFVTSHLVARSVRSE